MITIEQLKDIKERTEALNRYLDLSLIHISEPTRH